MLVRYATSRGSASPCDSERARGRMFGFAVEGALRSDSTCKSLSPLRTMDSSMRHARGATTVTTATFATDTAMVATPSGTVTQRAVAAAGVRVESSGFKKDKAIAEVVSEEI